MKIKYPKVVVILWNFQIFKKVYRSLGKVEKVKIVTFDPNLPHLCLNIIKMSYQIQNETNSYYLPAFFANFLFNFTENLLHISGVQKDSGGQKKCIH